MYYDFYVYTHDFADFDKAFEMVEALVEHINTKQLCGCNFNRYSSEGTERRSHVTIRLDLETESQLAKVNEKLTEMRTDGIIDDFTSNHPGVRPFREYSINHHIAHESSTKCAFRFFERRKNNPQRFREFADNKIGFLTEFVPLWLKHSGFVFQNLSSVQRPSSTLVESFVNECASIVRTVDIDRITDFEVFSERMLHTFMNSMSISSSDETTVLSNVASFLGYSDGARFIADLRYNGAHTQGFLAHVQKRFTCIGMYLKRFFHKL